MNFTQYQFTTAGFQMVLAPIRGSFLAQMEDAIHPAAQATQVAVANKVALVAQNADRITHVNGSRVYNVAVDSERGEVWYSLHPGSKARYYYPLQYASITIAAAVARPTMPKMNELCT